MADNRDITTDPRPGDVAASPNRYPWWTSTRILSVENGVVTSRTNREDVISVPLSEWTEWAKKQGKLIPIENQE